MSRSQTQKARVLAALRARGARGIDQTDFLAPDTIDNGKPITRVAARILELRDEGHTITVEGIRHGCAVYRLTHDMQDDAPAADSKPRPVVGLGDRLFAPPPRNAIFDDGEAA